MQIQDCKCLKASHCFYVHSTFEVFAHEGENANYKGDLAIVFVSWLDLAKQCGLIRAKYCVLNPCCIHCGFANVTDTICAFCVSVAVEKSGSTIIKTIHYGHSELNVLCKDTNTESASQFNHELLANNHNHMLRRMNCNHTNSNGGKTLIACSPYADLQSFLAIPNRIQNYDLETFVIAVACEIHEILFSEIRSRSP